VSYPGWIDGRAEVSRQAIEKYEAVRQPGRDWLAANRPPTITTVGPDAEPMAVPEGLTNVAAMEWLVERGYAERTSRDVGRISLRPAAGPGAARGRGPVVGVGHPELRREAIFEQAVHGARPDPDHRGELQSEE